MSRRATRTTFGLCVLLLSMGCVDRRFVVTTNVPGALVSVDGKAIGPTPVDERYDYAGWREFRVVAPGYEPLVQRVKFEPKWYDYPGLDLVAEVFWPFRIEDVRRVDLELQPLQPLRHEELSSRGENLRSRSTTLPPSSVPADQPKLTPGAADRQPQPGEVVPTLVPPLTFR